MTCFASETSTTNHRIGYEASLDATVGTVTGSAPVRSMDTVVTALGVAPKSNVVPSVPIDTPGRGEPSTLVQAPPTLASEPAKVSSPHTRSLSGASRYCVPLIVHARPSGNVPEARFGIAIGCVGTGGSTGPVGSSGRGSTAATAFCHSSSLTEWKLEANESRSFSLMPDALTVMTRPVSASNHTSVRYGGESDDEIITPGFPPTSTETGRSDGLGYTVRASAVPCDADTAIEGSCGWLRSSGPR